MIFPRERAVHEHLSTSYTQLDAMLAELKTDLFTGYIRLTARDYEGIVLLDAGRVLNATEDAKGRRRSDTKAVDGILAKSRERDGAISVFALSAEMATLLADACNSEVLYKDLTSDLTTLDRLIASLGTRRHNGYIDVTLSDLHETATIFLRNGDVLEATLCRNGTISDGPKVLDELVSAAATHGALYTVHSASTAPRDEEKKTPQTPDRSDHLGLWQDVLKAAEASADASTRTRTFAIAFKRACLELVEAYPFLDPFAAEFEYRDGQIRYDGRAGAAELNQGLSRCLAQCVRALAAQPGAKELSTRLTAAVSGLKKRHGGRLAECGLTEALPEVFGA